MNESKGELKALRARKGLTQKQMAEIIGITPEAYARKENGKNQFTLIEIQKICKYFEVSPMDIFFTNQCTKMVKKEA
jgi:DNA-binding XRE family transcriptional regulator